MDIKEWNHNRCSAMASENCLSFSLFGQRVKLGIFERRDRGDLSFAMPTPQQLSVQAPPSLNPVANVAAR
jgi:hypothetical protein